MMLRIPLYDVYFALFENNVLSVEHLSSPDASENEREVYQAFLVKSGLHFLRDPKPADYRFPHSL